MAEDSSKIVFNSASFSGSIVGEVHGNTLVAIFEDATDPQMGPDGVAIWVGQFKRAIPEGVTEVMVICEATNLMHPFAVEHVETALKAFLKDAAKVKLTLARRTSQAEVETARALANAAQRAGYFQAPSL